MSRHASVRTSPSASFKTSLFPGSFSTSSPCTTVPVFVVTRSTSAALAMVVAVSSARLIAKRARRIVIADGHATGKRAYRVATTVLALAAGACATAVPALVRTDAPPPLLIADVSNLQIAYVVPQDAAMQRAPEVVEAHDAATHDAAPADPGGLAESCNGGIMRACTLLGTQYLNGEGGRSKDAAMAASMYDRACKGGYPFGCTSLGVLTRHGTGVRLDASVSVSLFRRACEAGEPSACSQLGYAFDLGLGVTTDIAKATSYYREGCEGGDGSGCNNLAMLTLRRDPAQAATLFQKACALGNANACDSSRDR